MMNTNNNVFVKTERHNYRLTNSYSASTSLSLFSHTLTNTSFSHLAVPPLCIESEICCGSGDQVILLASETSLNIHTTSEMVIAIRGAAAVVMKLILIAVRLSKLQHRDSFQPVYASH